MTTPFESPRRTASGRRRLKELREKRKNESIFATPVRSRSVIIINVAVEIITAVIVIVGIASLVYFLRMRQYSVDPRLYRLIAACLSVFVVGWMVYLSFRLRHYIRLLAQFRKNGTDS